MTKNNKKQLVAVIGGGVIGAGWVARFVLNGHHVKLFDPDPSVKTRVQAVIDQADHAWRNLYQNALPQQGTFELCETLEDALTDAIWVQESLPERLELKQTILKTIDGLVPEETIIASSTSGFRPQELRQDLRYPDRMIVAHPFNPVYLLPLVELVGLSDDSKDTKRTHIHNFVTSLGMFPLFIAKEIDAHIADRLMEAVWREALWLVKDGIASTKDIDESIRMGFGLRWAQMGLFETFRIAGGKAGMRHFLEQFGPCLALPWTKLMEVPDYDDALVSLISEQSDQQSGAHTIEALEAIRDHNLVGFLSHLRQTGWGAGMVIEEHAEAMRQTSDHADSKKDSLLADMALSLTVLPSWIDYNGHMTESRYLFCASQMADQFLDRIGAGLNYVASGFSYYTAETHIQHKGEAKLGDCINQRLYVVKFDEKRLHIFTEQKVGEQLVATVEQIWLHVDMNQGKTSIAPQSIQDTIKQYETIQPALPNPEWVGRAIGRR